MSFTLPDLPYAYNALEPHIDERTMEIHHDKHHAAYVAKLNAALEGHADLEGRGIEDLLGNLDQLPEGIRTAVRNNGGGHFNHTLFWEIMAPGGPRGTFEEIGAAVDSLVGGFKGFVNLVKTFGSFEAFQEKFNAAGAGRFGSGWAWVCVDDDGKLFVCSTANQDSPLMKGVVDQAGTPILGIDVWEHAYYLKYQNRRPDYLKAVWSVINWAKVGENFAAAKARAVADLEQSEANLALAEIEIERDTKLLASATIAQSRYDATKATREAQAAIVEAKRADLRQAELNLTYIEITATFDGRIGKTHFSVGDVVGPASGPLASLVRVSPVYVGFSLSEGEYLSAVERLGGDVSKLLNPESSPPIRLRLPNGELFDETGWLVFVDNRVDPATGTIALRAQFENADGFLVPGIFVNVELESRETSAKLLVPQAAVQRDQKGNFVLVVGADGLVEQRHITTGQQVETDFVVEDGLQEGESVIVEGLQRVRPGVPVKAIGATGQGG